MAKRFTDKTVLITGGSSGIGFATAARLRQEGARVVITGRDKEKLDRAAAKLGDEDQVFPVVSDAANVEDIDYLVSMIERHVGRLDVTFANAGTGLFKPFTEFSEADFDQHVATNFKGVFFTIQKVLPLMNRGGAIILNASWTYHRPMGSAALYSATKAAVANLARTLTTELADRQIRVNAISPGYINTPLFNEDQLPEEEAAWRRGEVPMGRFGRAEEVANVVAFLASDEASYVAGQDILIDGGLVTAKVE